MELALGALACLMGYKLYEVVSDISAISSAAGTMDSADARNYVDYFGDDTAEPFELPLIDVAQPNDSVSEQPLVIAKDVSKDQIFQTLQEGGCVRIPLDFPTFHRLQDLYHDPDGLKQLFRQMMHLFQMHTVEREEPRLALTGQDDVGSLALSGGDFDNVLALIGEALDMPPEFMLALTSPEIGPALGHQQMQQLVQLFFRRQVFRFVKDTSMGRDQLFFEVNIGAMQRLFVDLNKRRQETGAIGWAKDDLDEPIPKKNPLMLTQSASISQFQAMVLQPELLCDMMASGKILRIAISSRDRDQLQQLYNDQEALARIIRQAMDLMRQKIVIPRDACQALPLAVQDNGPKKLFLQGASRSRSHEAPQTRSGIEAGWRMFTAGHTGPEQIWRMNTQGGGGRRPQTVQHLRTQAAFSMEEDCQIPYGAPMAFYGRGIPEQAWKAFNELDDSEIHEFIHFIFQINVFNLEEDSENPGQYVFTINFAAFQQLLEFLESLKPETGRVKELSSTDEEAESEFNTAMSSDDEDDEIILVVPDKELKAAEPVVKASPVCASEVTNTAASTKMPAALLCASIILGLLLV